MSFLLDTNVFLRLAEKNSPQRQTMFEALRKLRADQAIICYTPQILSEFWNVCTRPAISRGGLGLSIAETERKVSLIEKHFRLLPDSLATFKTWRRLVKDYSIVGVLGSRRKNCRFDDYLRS
ncbi:MAG: PIN domain-containing protein [Acidobacteria bacterium]|jgi:predicted nucleic acid-binding protein|nr:PIN domain-containing protein [Acidobacteriota bacterium]